MVCTISRDLMVAIRNREHTVSSASLLSSMFTSSQKFLSSFSLAFKTRHPCILSTNMDALPFHEHVPNESEEDDIREEKVQKRVEEDLLDYRPVQTDGLVIVSC